MGGKRHGLTRKRGRRGGGMVKKGVGGGVRVLVTVIANLFLDPSA